MRAITLAISFQLGLFSIALAQSEGSFPELHMTELIQGTANDIGFWGDGNVYVIELWGTWCAPCIKNIPKLTALQTKYKAKGLRVIGYSWENPEKVRKFLLKMGEKMQYILVNDQEEKFLKIVAEENEMVESFPNSFVIGRQGKLLWSGNPNDGLEAFIDDFINDQ